MAFRFFQSLVQKFTGKPIDWDELEEMLIRSDLGVSASMAILDRLRESTEPLTAETASQVAREEILKILPATELVIRPLPTKPKVILMIGVNGVGKTTSAAKFAHYLKSRRHSVLLVAADTFRAAAIEQLALWGERLGIEVFKPDYGADPASVCYDAYATALRRNIEFVICDTAGRLHTKNNLMQELAKVRRTLQKHDPSAPHESLLVVDATTGSNALQQAKVFKEVAGLTGVIITKLDGSGKGGVAIAIQKECDIPPRFIGVGEKAEDFRAFNREEFVTTIL